MAETISGFIGVSQDGRFFLVPKDLDSVLSRGTGLSLSIWGATGNPSVKRLLRHPDIAPRYYRALRNLADTVFSPDSIDATLDMLVGDTIPNTELQTMKDIARERHALVLSQIPSLNSIESGLPIVADAFQTTEASTSIFGKADVLRTARVLVNGREASFSTISGEWSVEGYPLYPGENRISAVMLAHDGEEVSREEVLVRRSTGEMVALPANIRSPLTLSPDDGPYLLESDVIVRAGGGLTIEPGTTIYFTQDRTLLMAGGTLVAEGTPNARIQFTRFPEDGTESYAGLSFTSDSVGNIVSYADVSFAGATELNRNVRVSSSEVLFDNVSFKKSSARIFLVSGPRLRIRGCEFPELVGQECLAGFGAMTGDQYFIVENNVFGSTTGYADIVDWSGGKRPGPILQVLNNVFLGGSDEALDLDGIDAHVEGNLFLNIKKDNGSTSTANAIATGSKDGVGSDLTVVRNVFVNCDHALLLKNGSRANFEHNTVVGSDESGINFGEPERGVPYGKEALVRGSIFKDNLVDFDNLIPAVDLIVQGSRVGEEWHSNGTGNISTDPLFVDEESGDYRLTPGSPAMGASANGLDMGAFVPPGASVSGLPVGSSGATSLTLPVYGPGIVFYKYALDDQPFGGETAIDTPISLELLSDGTHFVRVLGKNSAGVWQEESEAYRSREWSVDSSSGGRIRLSEVLAASKTAFDDAGTPRDYIEIENYGSEALDLVGYSLTDNLDEPKRYVFPPSITLGQSDFLVLLGGEGESLGKNYLGFGLDSSGEGIYLLDPLGNAVDSIEFGPQVRDLSIGRIGSGGWKLNQPTPGARNTEAAAGSPGRVVINEWGANPSVSIKADFLELFNPDPVPVAISGLHLTDNPSGDPKRQQIGPLSFIGPSNFVVFDRFSSPRLGFGLASEQGIISLMSETGQPLDQVFYHSQERDSSGGRSTDGAVSLSIFQHPTPGASNGATEPEPVEVTETILAYADVWRYNEEGVDLGTAWREVSFDDEGWKSGPGLIAKENAGLLEPIRTSLDLTTQNTIYFRREITFEGDPSETSLELSCLVDDGAVFYLNGQELFRFLMPDGEVTYDTPGLGVNNAVPAGPFVVDSKHLRAGTNVFAAEVHQVLPTSSDVVFGLKLDATYLKSPPPPEAFDGLRIVEIHYDPSGGTSHEFLELRNVASSPLDLEGVRFVGGIDYVFPKYELNPGERVVLAADPEQFESIYGEGRPLLGPYTGKLSNGGEEIVVYRKAPLELAIQRFSYNDAWYPSTDGRGKSLQIRDPYLANADWGRKSSWRPSDEDGGSPGDAVLWCDLRYPASVDWPGVVPRLEAVVTDEGLPLSGAATYEWSQTSGPADAVYGSVAASETTIEFPESGVYALSLLSTSGDETCVSSFTILAGTGLGAWLESHFDSTERADPNISGELADPDGDRLKNLLEYALGLDPRSSDAADFGVSAFAGETLFSYLRPPGLPGISYYLELSTDLETWNKVNDVVEEIEALPGAERVSLRVRSGMPEIDTLYLRLGVQQLR